MDQQQYQQAQHINQLGSTIKNIRQIAVDMHSELDDQHELLENIDHQTTTTQSKVGIAMRRVDQILIKDKQNCRIFILTIVLIVLLVVVIAI